jgi:hypothetical protein
MVGRYTHAHQFKRARRELKFLRTRLGRIIRDIRRKIEGNTALEDRFGPLLDLALRVRHQEQRQRGPKVYSLHAPEVECIGRGKARAPYEFGCKVSIATPVTAPKGGQFVLSAPTKLSPIVRHVAFDDDRAYDEIKPRRGWIAKPLHSLDQQPTKQSGRFTAFSAYHRGNGRSLGQT